MIDRAFNEKGSNMKIFLTCFSILLLVGCSSWPPADHKKGQTTYSHPCGKFSIYSSSTGIQAAISLDWGAKRPTLVKSTNYKSAALYSDGGCYGLLQTQNNTVELWRLTPFQRTQIGKIRNLPYTHISIPKNMNGHQSHSLTLELMAYRKAANGEGLDVLLISPADGKELVELTNVAEKEGQPDISVFGPLKYISVTGRSKYYWLTFKKADGQTGLLALTRAPNSIFASRAINFDNDNLRPGDWLSFYTNSPNEYQVDILMRENNRFDIASSDGKALTTQGFSHLHVFTFNSETIDGIHTRQPVELMNLLTRPGNSTALQQKLTTRYISERRTLGLQNAQELQWFTWESTKKQASTTPYQNIHFDDWDYIVQDMNGYWFRLDKPQNRYTTLPDLRQKLAVIRNEKDAALNTLLKQQSQQKTAVSPQQVVTELRAGKISRTARDRYSYNRLVSAAETVINEKGAGLSSEDIYALSQGLKSIYGADPAQINRLTTALDNIWSPKASGEAFQAREAAKSRERQEAAERAAELFKSSGGAPSLSTLEQDNEARKTGSKPYEIINKKPD